MRRRGQVLVELAVALPLILLLIIGGTEAGFLLATKAHQDRSTAVVAEWAAQHPGEAWQAVADRELHGCAVEVTSPVADVLEATARCVYHPVLFPGWDLLPISSRESAAVTR